MKKRNFMAIMFCLVSTLSFGQQLCVSDSTPIILPGCAFENQKLTVFDLIPDQTNTIEIYQNNALLESYSTDSCKFTFRISSPGIYDVTVKNQISNHNQKIIIQEQKEPLNDSTLTPETSVE